jgi:hypothetical protein
VTVTFTAAASYPDIRILEYSGIDPANPVDTVVGAVGNSATSSSGVVTTTNATDLLVGANTVQTLTAGPGSGSTLRLLTVPDGDIAEDWVVTTAGTYRASAPLTNAGGWVMQVVAFRAAGSAIPNPTPTPIPTATPGFVQGNYLDSATGATSESVAYSNNQSSGDYNVVAVTCAIGVTISSVVDSSGNSYSLVAGPLANSSEGSVVSIYVAPGMTF